MGGHRSAKIHGFGHSFVCTPKTVLKIVAAAAAASGMRLGGCPCHDVKSE
jgi:hypothetical protein